MTQCRGAAVQQHSAVLRRSCKTLENMLESARNQEHETWNPELSSLKLVEISFALGLLDCYFPWQHVSWCTFIKIIYTRSQPPIATVDGSLSVQGHSEVDGPMIGPQVSSYDCFEFWC